MFPVHFCYYNIHESFIFLLVCAGPPNYKSDKKEGILVLVNNNHQGSHVSCSLWLLSSPVLNLLCEDILSVVLINIIQCI